MASDALKELLFKIADDLLISGHRNSEWTGMGPLLEEDIAFSSMAQDKIGQSQALYQILNELGEAAPDTLAFMREEAKFRNCVLVELPNGEYDFSIVRHFLLDTSLALRFEMLTTSSFVPLAQLAAKVRGELRYHTLHGDTWMHRLGNATAESISRMQSALDYTMPFALGIFEQSPYEKELKQEGIFAGEQVLRERWEQRVSAVLSRTQLNMKPFANIIPVEGGRLGKHSEFLKPLLDEMGEVFRIDPAAEW
jgi:ring-1,2-phenylacetyl-CoA epoxidase subunit PaaC